MSDDYWHRTFWLGGNRRRIDVWRPRHPSRVGTHATRGGSHRVWSLRWLMVRVWHRHAATRIHRP